MNSFILLLVSPEVFTKIQATEHYALLNEDAQVIDGVEDGMLKLLPFLGAGNHEGAPLTYASLSTHAALDVVTTDRLAVVVKDCENKLVRIGRLFAVLAHCLHSEVEADHTAIMGNLNLPQEEEEGHVANDEECLECGEHIDDCECGDSNDESED